MEIKAADGVLSGTLCLPSAAGPFPCVLMLPGSGPLDRDENFEGQRLDIFNTIAHQLAQTGLCEPKVRQAGLWQEYRRVLPSRLLRFRRGCNCLLR